MQLKHTLPLACFSQVGVEALSCTRTTALSRQAYQTLPLITHYSDGQGGDRIRDSSYVAQLWSELRLFSVYQRSDVFLSQLLKSHCVEILYVGQSSEEQTS